MNRIIALLIALLSLPVAAQQVAVSSQTLGANAAAPCPARAMSARRSMTIQNNDTAPIQIGFSAAAASSSSTAWILAAGGTMTLPLASQQDSTYGVQAYCWSALGTLANAVQVFESVSPAGGVATTGAPLGTSTGIYTQQATPSTVTGSVLGPNDAVTFAISGAQWANAHFTAVYGTAQTTSLAVESSSDGVNWAGAGDYGTTTRGMAPMVIRTDAVTMNPTVALASTGSGLNLNSYAQSTAWDFPISGVTTLVRVRSISTMTYPVTISWSAGVPITPGVPVVATLFDVLGGTNANIDSGVMDFRGWSAMVWSFSQVAGLISALQVEAFEVNDTNGSNSDSFAIFTATPVVTGNAAGGTSYGTSYFWGAKTGSPAATTIGGSLPKRGRVFSGSSAGVQTRMRVEMVRNQ